MSDKCKKCVFVEKFVSETDSSNVLYICTAEEPEIEFDGGQRYFDSDEGTASDNPYKEGTREWNLWLQGYAEKFWQDFDQEPA